MYEFLRDGEITTSTAYVVRFYVCVGNVPYCTKVGKLLRLSLTSLFYVSYVDPLLVRGYLFSRRCSHSMYRAVSDYFVPMYRQVIIDSWTNRRRTAVDSSLGEQELNAGEEKSFFDRL